MITKEDIINVAKSCGALSINTDADSAWIMAQTPEQFKSYLEKTFGFEVIECKATNDFRRVIATTACGLCIDWDGFCHYKRKNT